MKRLLRWLSRIGPGFVVCAVVLGPGSLTAATKMGAQYRYGLLWAPLLAGAAMAFFTAAFMRHGIESDRSFLSQVAGRWGRTYAALCGLAMFWVCAGFQFGNNIGVATGMDGLLARSVAAGRPPEPILPPWAWIVGFNACSLLFLFSFRKVYSLIEKTMTVLVGVMVVVFLANLWFVRGRLSGDWSDYRPALPGDMDFFLAAGMVATTFSIVAAIFQSYLVRARGWTRQDYSRGMGDSLTGIAILTAVTLVVAVTSASVLPPGARVNTAADMAGQLEAMCGPLSRIIFCVGFVAAAFSSFLVNAMIGGTLLADGLGLGDDMSSRPAKLLAAAALLVGMVIALVVKSNSVSFADALLLGEAGTLLTVPLLIPAVLLVLFSRKGSTFTPVRPAGRFLAVAGLGLLLFMGIISLDKIIMRVAMAFGR